MLLRCCCRCFSSSRHGLPLTPRSLGATVIGINNRNLHTFELDLGTTARVRADFFCPSLLRAPSRLTRPSPLFRSQVSRVASGRGYAFGPDVVAAPGAEKQIVLMALSGISRSDDVDDCRAVGVEGVLVGEALMRAADPQAAIVALLDAPEAAAPPVVKVCGVTTADDARAAVEANANLIGVIFAAKSKRRVSAEQARSIVGAVRAFGERTDKVAVPLSQIFDILPIAGTVQPEESVSMQFTYFGLGNKILNATFVCQCEGGPDYEVTL